jgi:uncharacterized protein YqjF (DUF2071 family)
MERAIHQGTLYRDGNRRYCVYEGGSVERHVLTCTSGCPLEVWLYRAWIAGHVEGDGQDYWLFTYAGGKFLLAEQMRVRYVERL